MDTNPEVRSTYQFAINRGKEARDERVSSEEETEALTDWTADEGVFDEIDQQDLFSAKTYKENYLDDQRDSVLDRQRRNEFSNLTLNTVPDETKAATLMGVILVLVGIAAASLSISSFFYIFRSLRD